MQVHGHAKRALHHVEELVVVDLTISICVDTLEQDLDLFVAQSEVVARQALLQLLGADRPAVILVEVGKGRS